MEQEGVITYHLATLNKLIAEEMLVEPDIRLNTNFLLVSNFLLYETKN